MLASKTLGHDVGNVVWKPGDIDPAGGTRYPVVYFLHGMGGNESADAGGFSSLVAKAIRQGELPPLLCVFPNGGRSGYRGEVESMIVQELVPLIDQSFPTRPESGSRVVAGFSMGGAGAVRLALLHPELFSAAGSWGGGMWRESDALLAAAEKHVSVLKKHGFAALLVNGDKDSPDAFKPLAEKFSGLGIRHEVVVLDDTPHNLGLYYQRAGETMTRFLGRQLRAGQGDHTGTAP